MDIRRDGHGLESSETVRGARPAKTDRVQAKGGRHRTGVRHKADVQPSTPAPASDPALAPRYRSSTRNASHPRERTWTRTSSGHFSRASFPRIWRVTPAARASYDTAMRLPLDLSTRRFSSMPMSCSTNKYPKRIKIRKHGDHGRRSPPEQARQIFCTLIAERTRR